MALAAGTASTAFAGADRLAVSRDTAGVVSLRLGDGPTIHSTAGAISGPRLISFRGSSAQVAVWDETTGGSVQHYYAIAPNGRGFTQVQTTQNQIGLAYATFDPLAGEPAVPPALRANASNEQYLVQFVSTPLDEMRREITGLGGTVERFLPENTHVVRMSRQARDRVAALPYVRWVGAYHPAYRAPDWLRADLMDPNNDGSAVRYSIECMAVGPAQQQAVGDFIRQIGGIVDMTVPDQYRLEATLTPGQLVKVLQRNEVNFVDGSGAPYGADVQFERTLEGADYLQMQTGFAGQGVRGEVFDQGCIPNHQQWNGQAPLVHVSNSPTDHGTACYGVIFATGTGDAAAIGLCPMREQGIIANYLDTNQAGLGSGTHSRLSLNTEATDPNGMFHSCFQSSSVGSPQVTTYTTVSAEVDDYLWRVDYLSCQSQSNTGSRSSRPQAWAKNIVSVGGIDFRQTQDRSDDIWATNASQGPATELRVKPDLANGFWNVHTTYSTSPTGYGEFNGTSSATPLTTGHFGMMMQMWHQGVWSGFGGGSSVFADRPKSTTAKALMINTAYRYTPTTGNQMYRCNVGWGVTDLQRLYDIRAHTFIVNESDPVQNAQSNTYHLNVLPGEPEARFTLVYADPMGNPSAGQQRINDLSLRVTSPGGTVYWGNNGMIATAISGAGQLVGANYTAPGGSENHVDTVENVFVQNPEAGSWTVDVLGTQVVQDEYPTTPATDAVYGFVATGVLPGPPPAITILFPAGAPALIAPNTPTNIDFQVIPGSQNVLPGSPTLLYRFSSSSSYISLPATSLGNNNYRAVLPGAACGSTAQFYFTAMGDMGGSASLPANAPTTVYSSPVAAITMTTALDVDFSGASFPAGWSATGLWHISSGCAGGAGNCNAGSQWAYYGQEASCNYNTGTANQGTLTAPPIMIPPVPPGGSLSLTFCYNLTTENSAGHDLAQVLVNGNVVDTCPDSANWATRTVDMAPFAGQTVTLAFRFNTVDGVFNNFRGWQLDSVRIAGQSIGCPQTCYANCDNSTTAPILNVNDFVCFQSRFAAGDTYANCDGSTQPPVLNVNDFVCFQSAFAAGCP